ncbi:putative uncharacterized protein BRD3OS isoform X1 [Elephas maximus indicus]|uniref:putative uncharacterized protein BRD3OS isoform X1 n=1 Tax=Elephas maximus indicus TaxID=99487 RepID=UPI002115F356|nr:putative uncharacterized protein BRD3OS isoform X1 [Elephas maximus indicus]
METRPEPTRGLPASRGPEPRPGQGVRLRPPHRPHVAGPTAPVTCRGRLGGPGDGGGGARVWRGLPDACRRKRCWWPASSLGQVEDHPGKKGTDAASGSQMCIGTQLLQ